ncbi:MAG: glycosyltransferase, partial [Bacteroidota bacterium]|nr:glycosyltransferase [Bacteroidota bacterium]
MISGDFKYKVSIVLTLFNSKNYYLRAVNSVLNQTFKNYELIIVDDGSTDAIETELFFLLKQNHDFIYIRHSNKGHALSLNTGINISTAKLITFLDSDDEYKPGHIEERVNYFENNKSVDLIYSPATIIGDEEDLFVPDARDKSKLIHLNDCVIGGTFFGKRQVFE